MITSASSGMIPLADSQSARKLPNNIRDFSYNVIFAVEFLNYNGLKYHQKFID